MKSDDARREFLRASAVAGAGLVLVGCGGGSKTEPEQKAGGQTQAVEGDKEEGGEVTATEDLMREHGVLRRALLVYVAAASKLRANPSSVPPDALQKTANLFRSFGEEYHEKKLEEAFIFPAVKKAGGGAAAYPDVLVVQHERGREITDYVLAATRGAKLGAASAAQLARVL